MPLPGHHPRQGVLRAALRHHVHRTSEIPGLADFTRDRPGTVEQIRPTTGTSADRSAWRRGAHRRPGIAAGLPGRRAVAVPRSPGRAASTAGPFRSVSDPPRNVRVI